MGLSNVLTKYPLKLRQKDLPFMLVDASRFEKVTNLWLVPLVTRHLKRASFPVFLAQVYPLLVQVETLYPTLTDEYMVNFVFTIRQMLWQIFSVAYEQGPSDQYPEPALTAFLQLA